MKNLSTVNIIVIVGLVILLCCACLAVASILGISIFSIYSTQVSPDITNPPFQGTLAVTVPPPFVETPVLQPTPAAQVTPQAGQPNGEETLRLLENTIISNSSILELAERLGGKAAIPETLPGPPAPLEVGNSQQFYVTNVDTHEKRQVDATLRHVTDHAYFWIEDGVSYNNRALQELMDSFENQIYPTDREFFGSEWTPGVDNDPHLYILYASDLGAGLAGYYSSSDEYSPLANEYSNAHEMFLLNTDTLDLAEEYTYSVLAHEFQHMIHWYRDRNEASWLNEGFSVLAQLLNGYEIGGFDYTFSANPETQLNDWPNDSNATSPHYGSSFLFLAYFLDRFGEQMTQELVGEQANDLVSIDTILSRANQDDPVTQQPILADDVFQDWTVTNYLHDAQVDDGRYTYKTYTQAPSVPETETLSDCPASEETRTVTQYGADYIRLLCSGSYTLTFQGNPQVGVIPENAHSGSYAFWSNKGDESDMTLTQSFDFTSVSGSLTLTYYTWYDLEEDYDYIYLLARPEGGEWQILTTPSGTPENPSGNSYGWGYNGVSPDWIQEEVDISQFAGNKVELRFEYVTDAAVNGEGMLLDDIAIPETGYLTDFEEDDGGWQADGFVRMDNILPQTFRIALISRGSETTVAKYSVEPGQALQIPLEFQNGVDEIVLVVSGTTRFTRQHANYQFSID